ncbi:hypothetical protein [Muricoccus radiodurans]|uniref:hypothetical protein n=1 Tax=Muricoccus radiodurans TaxID=2231721 RepID=UPI003CEF9244
MRAIATLAGASPVLAVMVAPALAQERRPAAPTPMTIEEQCRQEVARRYPPGSLSRGRRERENLIASCVANGGRLP